MNTSILDTSCWLEIFCCGKLKAQCEKELKKDSHIIVPVLIFYEVYKKIVISLSDDQALSACAYLCKFDVQDLTREIALDAADLSIKNKLSMADSLILSFAYYNNAALVTLDNDFASLPNVKVIRK